MEKIRLNDFVVCIILFVLGQAFYKGENFVIFAAYIALVVAGNKTKIPSVVCILSVFIAWCIAPVTGKDIVLEDIYSPVISFLSYIIVLEPLKKRKLLHSRYKIIVTSLVVVSYLFSTYYIKGFNIRIVATIAIICALGIIFEPAFKKINEGMYSGITKEELVSIVSLIFACVLSLPDLEADYFSLKMTLVLLLLLWGAYSYGAGAGALIGSFGAIILGDTLQEIFSYIPVLVFSGICAGILSKAGKLFSSMAYAIIIFSYYLYFTSTDVSYLRCDLCLPGAALSSVIIFMLLPMKKLKISLNEGNLMISGFDDENIRSHTRMMLSDMAEEFMKLSLRMQGDSLINTVPDMDKQNEVIEDVTITLCNACDEKDKCWGENYGATMSGIGLVYDSIMQNDMYSVQVDEFRKKCIYAQEFLNRTQYGIDHLKQNIKWNNHSKEMREVMSVQMREVSGLINECAQGMIEPVNIGYMKKMKIIKELLLEHVAVKGISFLQKNDGRFMVTVNCAVTSKEEVQTVKVAKILSKNLGKKLTASQGENRVITKTYVNYNFIERTNFKTITGVARIGKGGKKINGDNYSIMTSPDKSTILMIADGCGSGNSAYEISNEIIGMMERFTQAGFRGDIAVRLVNSMMYSNTEDDTCTIDYCKINRYTGICNFTKVGCASSFIKRKKWVETISAQNYPAGILGEVDCDTSVKKLYDGNYIIMVSDGILDSLGENATEKLQDFIAGTKIINPKEFADEILKYAINQSQECILDDMTVLVAGIWKR